MMTLTLNDLDWVQTRTGDVLHRMSSYGETDDEEVAWWFPVELDCGRTVGYATIPAPVHSNGGQAVRPML